MSEVSSAGKIVHVFLVLLEVSWAPGWSPMLIYAQQTLMAQLGHNQGLAMFHHVDAWFAWQF